MPADVPSLLATIPDPEGRAIPYREEIGHPALAAPEVAEGSLSVEDGRLVRQQRVPEAETAVIGETTLSLTSESSGSKNVLPIPAKMQPTLRTLRAVMTGNVAAFLGPVALAPAKGSGGWTLAFPDLDADLGVMTVSGCGARVRQVDIVEATGTRRTIHLGTPE
ncbi:MAG: hypothetical protein AAFV19_06385 [Pseudomonadota bacterium]